MIAQRGERERERGEGKVLFFAFELGASAQNEIAFQGLLKSTLAYIHKPLDAAAFRPNQLVPVEITVKSLGAPFDVRITETYPEEIKVYEPATGAWIPNANWASNTHLEPGETKTILFYALAPDKPGTYTLQTEVGYLENGTYTAYQNLTADIVVLKDSAAMSADIISALESLAASGKERAKIDIAAGYIKNVRSRAVLSARDREDNIHDLLKAVDALLAITVDASGTRLMLDGLLAFWEAEWYFWDKEIGILTSGR